VAASAELTGAAWIGTSGWNYKHWKGSIYPPGVAQKRWLAHLSSQWFDTVELNTSFYRIPTESSVDEWNRVAPPNFRFALKLWRGITHYRKLRNSVEFLERFFKVMDRLDASHRGPLLIQLPPNQGKDIEKLDSFLTDLKGVAGRRWKQAVEFRNTAWYTGDVYSLLDRRGVALCIHDMRGSAVDRPNDVPLVYVRRHGPTEKKYHGSYTSEQLKEDARRIKAWLAERRDVWIYYNNDVGGHAVRNAQELKRLVGG
jgi:uncharacterized protein YecE (DUF72 family)